MKPTPSEYTDAILATATLAACAAAILIWWAILP